MKAKLIPQEIIEDIASKQRVEWGLSETEPINVKTILRKLNILTIYRPLSMDSCGVSLMTADKTKRFMLINSNCPRGRQHFTIAHELFHLFVDENPEPHICKESGEKDNNEKNADEERELFAPGHFTKECIPFHLGSVKIGRASCRERV